MNPLILDIYCNKPKHEYGRHQEYHRHNEGDHPEVSSSIIYHVADVVPLEIAIEWVVRWNITRQAISKDKILKHIHLYHIKNIQDYRKGYHGIDDAFVLFAAFIVFVIYVDSAVAFNHHNNTNIDHCLSIVKVNVSVSVEIGCTW